jgi:hypothetical protein
MTKFTLPTRSTSQEFLPPDVVESNPNRGIRVSGSVDSKLSQLQHQQQAESSDEYSYRESEISRIHPVKYSVIGLHAETSPRQFDHNFSSAKPIMSSMPKHLPPIRELSATLSQTKSKETEAEKHLEHRSELLVEKLNPLKAQIDSEVVQPQIKSSQKSDTSLSPAEVERQTRFRNKVLSANNSVDLSDLNQPVSKRVLKTPFLIRVQVTFS